MAARLEGIADPGGILISSKVHMQAYVARGKWHRRCAGAASSGLRAGMAGTLKGRSRQDDDLSGAGAGSNSRIAPQSSLSLWSARSANARSHSPQSGDN
jgi:hypothetical protein